jgi:hypothetical protein
METSRLTSTRHRVVLALAKRIAFTETGILNIPLVQEWAAKIDIDDKDAEIVDKLRWLRLPEDTFPLFRSSWHVVTMEAFCAALILEMGSHGSFSLNNPQSRVSITRLLIDTVERKLDYFGQQGVLYDCNTDLSQMTVEAKVIMLALNMYTEHARQQGFTISDSHLAEVWSASLRAMWKCRLNQNLWEFKSGPATDYAATATYFSSDELWARLVTSLAIAIVERMIVAIVSIRYGLNFKLGKVEIKDNSPRSFAEMVVGGNEPTLDILSYVLNTKCKLIVTDRHMLTPNSLKVRIPGLVEQVESELAMTQTPDIVTIHATRPEDPKFITLQMKTEPASSSSAAAAAAAAATR